MRVLCAMQQAIQTLHDVELDLDVSAYIVGDEARRDLPGAREGLPEQLFVREDGDAMEIALYIAPTIMAKLEQDDPLLHLHPGNLEDFCIALEGVSHFVFLAWRASVGWPVSALEMEIQAEVDKFVAAWLLMAEQGSTLHASGPNLARQLFESYELREDLDADEVERYHTASRAAGGFCRRLLKRYGQTRRYADIRREARTYYRRSLEQKLSHAG